MKLKAWLRSSVLVGASLLACAAMAQTAGVTWLDEPAEGAYDVTGTLTVATPASLKADIVFNNATGKPDAPEYKLVVTSKGAQFYRVEGPKATALGWSEASPVAATKEGVTFTLQRRDWQMAFILGNHVIARAYDAGLKSGKVGTAATGGTWGDVRVQPVGNIILRDDFVRDVGEQSAWESVQGTWAQQTLREDPQATRMEADKSTNAFCYLGKADKGRALSVGGYWFWNSYTFKAAVRPEGDGAVGIVFHYQDAKNYMAVRWTSRVSEAKDADQIQLLQVLDGKETVLATKPGGFEPERWYALRVNACDDLIQCFLDDEVVLQKRTNALGQGQVGFLAEGAKGGYFDDAEALDWEVFSDELATPVPGKWEATAGNWQFGKDDVARAVSSEAMLLTGRAAWRNYVCSVDAKSAGGQGMLFAVTDGGYYTFRWAPKGSKSAFAGRAQVLKVSGKERKVIADAEAPISGTEWHRVKVETEDGFVCGYVDDKPLVRTFDAAASSGRIGLYADGSTAFRRAYLSMIPPRTSAHVTKEFTNTSEHPEMAEWASTRAPWVKPETETENAVWWTKGDYYGDQCMRFAIPNPGSKTGTLRAVLEADPATKDSGYVLTIAATAGSKKLDVRLSAGGKELAKADVDAVGDPCPVVYERRDGFVVVEIDGKPVLMVQ